MMNEKLYKVLGAAVLCGGVSTGGAVQAGDAFSANIGVTSNYVFRGATQTGNGAAIQGGIDYEDGGTGVYVGAWMSNVNFGDDNDDNQYELDGYFGWGTDLSEDVTLDLGYVYYHYGDLESGGDFGEVYANVSYLWFTFGAFYTLHSQVDDEPGAAFIDDDIFYHADFAIDLTESWSLGVTVGYYDFANDGDLVEDEKADLSYAYGQVDLTKSGGDLGDFTFSVSQAGDEANVDNGDGRAKVFVSWVKGF